MNPFTPSLCDPCGTADVLSSTEPLFVMHVMPQLRFGAGRVVADMAIAQARNPRRRVGVFVSADFDEHWKSDPKLIAELREHNVLFEVIGDFFHRKTVDLHSSAARLREVGESGPETRVVHAHSAMAAAVGHWSRPDALVATCHGWGVGRPEAFDLQDSLAYQFCDSVFTYSRHWVDRLRQDLAVENCRVLPMGLCLERFPELPERSIPDSDPFRLVTVCELTARKGVDVLLAAMPVVWQRFPATELHVIGNGDSAESLRQMAAALDGSSRRIVFHGAVSDPYQHFGKFDLLVLASRSDNLPVVLLEAMLAGLPLLATHVGGSPDLIAAAECGTTVPPEDAAALGEVMISLLAKSRRELERIGRKGETYGRREFDVNGAILRIEDLYWQALVKKTGDSRRFSELPRTDGCPWLSHP